MDHVSSQHQHDAFSADRLGRADDAVSRGTAKRALFVALAIAVVLACLALGAWQLQRRAEKLELIARIDSRIHAAARPVPARAEWPRVTAHDHAYRRVRTTGVLLHERETVVQAVTEGGGGYWVMTPLRTPDGTILVNRGFVPPERRDLATRRGGQVAGPVTITGLLRMSEPGGGFLRANDPARDRWYSRDVAGIARARKLGTVAPYFIDADAAANPGGYPVGGLTVVALRNSHLAYALTWFALAALGATAMIRLLRRDGRGIEPGPPLQGS